MSVRIFVLLAGCLALPTTASGQKVAEASPRPDPGQRDAIHGPRFLHALHEGSSNRGVRLTGDVDGDGDLDILVLGHVNGRYLPPRAEIWLNDGAAAFGRAGEIPFELPGSDDSFFIARYPWLADVTGDAILDLVLDRDDVFEAIGPSGALVHPGLGDGTFGPMMLIEVDRLSEVVVGDCDADGDADVLMHYRPTGGLRAIAWWTHEGGSFVQGPSLSFATGEAPQLLALFDLEGDGCADAVAMKNALGDDQVMVFRTVAGAPTLVDTIVVPGGPWNGSRVRSADLDVDGDDDLLLLHSDFLASDYRFLPLWRTVSGFTPGSIQTLEIVEPDLQDGVLADWDEDGDPDFVSPSYSWFENDGTGSFALVAEQRSAFSSNTGSMVVADLDGDEHLDALAEWSFVSGAGRMPGASSISPSDGLPAGAWTVVEDWEGDGDQDLVAYSRLFLNRGDGSFEDRYLQFFGLSEPVGDMVGWGDFDGDGFRDAVLSIFELQPYPEPPLFVEMRLYAGDSRGDYHLSPIEPSPVEMEVAGTTLAADVDGDGDQDILMEDHYWRNDGDAHFGTAPVSGLYLGLPLAALDLDSDLDLDLLVRRNGRLELLRRVSPAAFAAQDLGPSGTAAKPVFLDADEDEDLDLVVTEPPQDVIRVHEQVSPGLLAPALELATPNVGSAAAQIDLDGDGRLDLVCTRDCDGNGAVLPPRVLSGWIRGDGLQFDERREWIVRRHALEFGDFDGDGDVDALGQENIENLQFQGVRAGRRVQYALDCGAPGTGGITPVLGADGPFRAGGTPELVLARGRGRASGVLHVGRRRGPSSSCSALVFIDPVILYRSYQLGGPPGAPGKGSLRVALEPELAMLGRTFTFQSLIFDAGGASGYASTNALEITMGDWMPAIAR